jgi:anti-sigma regulatory factor (Ser/Thr protein kinase)
MRPAEPPPTVQTVDQILQTELPRDAVAGRLARRLIERNLDLAPDELDAVKSLVTELVNNAVVHGQGKILLNAAVNPKRVRAEVVDEGSGFEAGICAAAGGIKQNGGRGLQVVDACASRWGVYEGTTHVWFELDRHTD